MDFEKLKNDPKREDDGEWMEIPGFPGLRGKFRSLRSGLWQQLEIRIMARKRQMLLMGGEAAAKAKVETDLQCLREVGVRDVDGITENGQPLPWGVTLAAQLLSWENRRDWADFQRACLICCQLVAEVDRAEDSSEGQEEPGKGSAPPSDASSSSPS